jgi:hypothetical protein
VYQQIWLDLPAAGTWAVRGILSAEIVGSFSGSYLGKHCFPFKREKNCLSIEARFEQKFEKYSSVGIGTNESQAAFKETTGLCQSD